MKNVLRAGVSVGAALLMVAGLATTASAHGSWNNGWTTVVSRNDGLYIGTLEVQIETYGAASYHASAWGPGFSTNLKTEYVTGNRRYIGYLVLNRYFHSGDRICAEGWKYNGHGYTGQGLPCFTIRA
jgi:hypothetical protein